MVNHSNILSVQSQIDIRSGRGITQSNHTTMPEILFITSYPPRECGIATYSQDLIKALSNKFNRSFVIRICALESENEKHLYADEVKYILDADQPNTFLPLAETINCNATIRMILIQHEFGFYKKIETEFGQFLKALTKPIIFAFHTVLPAPNELLKANVQQMAGIAQSVIVMTNSSAKILINDYGLSPQKIAIIRHGTHLVPHSDNYLLKKKYTLSGKKVLSTFGLLGSGKSIETTLNALPAIIEINPDVIFLIIGKTHPSIKKREGEKYREMLEALVAELDIGEHVRFINYFLPLPDLLEYLQLTDIYLFTSRDPNQAVSGTFSYAISSGCPVISTPIPHAREVLRNDAGIIIDFEDPEQLADAVNNLLADDQRRKNISANGLHRMAPTAWENAAIKHAILLQRASLGSISLNYSLPPLNLDHIKKLTTDFGMIQFSKINQPDLDSGYTLDDNARALIATCMHFELTKDEATLPLIEIYFSFIKHCLQPGGHFLNYVNENKTFTKQNTSTNLEDANGRAIWAVGYMTSLRELLPIDLITDGEKIIQQALPNVSDIRSTRSMAFIIKGLFYYKVGKSKAEEHEMPDLPIHIIRKLADRLVQMYKHEANDEWKWFESYLTYANGVLPEALLCAWSITGELIFKEVAQSSFDFLLSKTFRGSGIKVISNKGWLRSGDRSVEARSGEQPIDVAYTILALNHFFEVFKDKEYFIKMRLAFDWFLGSNHLHQIIYNPCTGGCYDGLEDSYVNLNQGAESTVSYLMARITVDPEFRRNKNQKNEYERSKFTEPAL